MQVDRPSRPQDRHVVQRLAALLPETQFPGQADWHAVERARLAAVGRTPSFVDGQIAAISRVRDLTLVTANALDFSDFEGLRVRNWA